MITNYQKHFILQMRRGGMTFAEIGEALGLSSNTVKSVCRRNTLKEQQDGHLPGTVCKNCGEPLKQTPGARRKVFCDNHCRYEWWNRTRAKKPYLLTCYHCGKQFTSYGNRKRKFCGRECYLLSRYGEGLP